MSEPCGAPQVERGPSVYLSCFALRIYSSTTTPSTMGKKKLSLKRELQRIWCSVAKLYSCSARLCHDLDTHQESESQDGNASLGYQRHSQATGRHQNR